MPTTAQGEDGLHRTWGWRKLLKKKSRWNHSLVLKQGWEQFVFPPDRGGKPGFIIAFNIELWELAYKVISFIELFETVAVVTMKIFIVSLLSEHT